METILIEGSFYPKSTIIGLAFANNKWAQDQIIRLASEKDSWATNQLINILEKNYPWAQIILEQYCRADSNWAKKILFEMCLLNNSWCFNLLLQFVNRNYLWAIKYYSQLLLIENYSILMNESDILIPLQDQLENEPVFRYLKETEINIFNYDDKIMIPSDHKKGGILKLALIAFENTLYLNNIIEKSDNKSTEELKKEIENCKEANNVIQNNFQFYEEKLQEFCENLENVKENSKFKQQIEELQLENSILKNTITKLQTNLNQTNSKLSNLEDSMLELKKIISLQNTSIHQHSDIINNLSSNIISHPNSNIKGEMIDKGIIDLIRTDLLNFQKDFDQRISTNSQNFIDLKNKIIRIEEKSNNFDFNFNKDDISTLKLEINGLLNKYSNLNDDIKQQSSKIDQNISNELNKLKNEFSNIKNSYNSEPKSLNTKSIRRFNSNSPSNQKKLNDFIIRDKISVLQESPLSTFDTKYFDKPLPIEENKLNDPSEIKDTITLHKDLQNNNSIPLLSNINNSNVEKTSSEVLDEKLPNNKSNLLKEENDNKTPSEISKKTILDEKLPNNKSNLLKEENNNKIPSEISKNNTQDSIDPSKLSLKDRIKFYQNLKK